MAPKIQGTAYHQMIITNCGCGLELAASEFDFCTGFLYIFCVKTIHRSFMYKKKSEDKESLTITPLWSDRDSHTMSWTGMAPWWSRDSGSDSGEGMNILIDELCSGTCSVEAWDPEVTDNSSSERSVLKFERVNALIQLVELEACKEKHITNKPDRQAVHKVI